MDGQEARSVSKHVSSDPGAPSDRRFTSHWAFRHDFANNRSRSAQLDVFSEDNALLASRKLSIKLQKRFAFRKRTLTYFIHIEKTAGTTLRKMTESRKDISILPVYHDTPECAVRTFSPLALDDFDLVYGHFSYGLHECFRRRARYISIVRKPEDFVKSYYLFIKYASTDARYDQCRDIFEAIERVDDAAFDNRFTRYFLGDLNIKAISEREYNVVIQNIENIFDLIGLREDIERFKRLVCKRFGVKYAALRENVTPPNPEGGAINSTELRHALGDKLIWDLRLYEFLASRWYRRFPLGATPSSCQLR